MVLAEGMVVYVIVLAWYISTEVDLNPHLKKKVHCHSY
jgi:hypothetical protein